MKNNDVDVFKLVLVFKIIWFCFTNCGHTLDYEKNPAPDGHRCGICPTYLQKICAFDFGSNATFIFDNHCVMDLYNCVHGTDFVNQNYEECLYFGNFAYVHGYKYSDDPTDTLILNIKKNPDFIQ